jgi:uncharacterized damage-inducible protein DinB
MRRIGPEWTMKWNIAGAFCVCTAAAFAADDNFAAEFNQRWIAARKLTVGVAEAMRADEYLFKPDPPSMNFGEQMLHIAWANYAFCSTLKDQKPPNAGAPQLPSEPKTAKVAPVTASAEKDAIVKYVADSWDYCTRQISTVTSAQMNAIHSTPDGELNGRELLLALYVHLAHHRGQAEIYLRIKGIAPPPYVF